MSNRLQRLDVSIDMAVHVVLLQLFARGVVPLLLENPRLGCGTGLTHYVDSRAEELQGWPGLGLVILVLLVMWLETRVTLRPWFKRLLRLGGPLFLASLMLPFLFILLVPPFEDLPPPGKAAASLKSMTDKKMR